MGGDHCMAMTSDGVFGVDVDGWVKQHRSRDTYEVVREAVQNALDTESDLYVRVDYDDQAVVVEDYHDDGVEELSHFYDLFSGDKRHDPTQRGRFGRGIKEFIGASEETVISSTGGALRFEIGSEYDEEEDKVHVDAERTEYTGAERHKGTVVYGHNPEWSQDDLHQVQKFIKNLWVPKGQEIMLDVQGEELPDSVDEPYETVLTHDEPDASIDRQKLKTLVVDDGVQKEERRNTTVEIRRTTEGEGGVYEMGIPVTMEDDMPFVFNVHQKTPVTERRTELDDDYREDLVQALLNEHLDLVHDDELTEEYLTQHLSTASYKIDTDIQQEYIRRLLDSDLDETLVYTEDTPVSWIQAAQQQHNFTVENAEEYSSNVGSLLESHLKSVEEWHGELESGQVIEPVEPTEAQETFMEYVQDELVERSGIWADIEMQTARITDEKDGQTKAMYHPNDDVIYLNTLAEDWEEPSAELNGVMVHELAHEERPASGHGQGWWNKMEKLAGEVIEDLYDDLERVTGERDRLQEENRRLEREVDRRYTGPADYVKQKTVGFKDGIVDMVDTLLGRDRHEPPFDDV